MILGARRGPRRPGQPVRVARGPPARTRRCAPRHWRSCRSGRRTRSRGILLNVAAGRVANRFDLGGANYTVDAACASSLAAVLPRARELERGTSDLVHGRRADTVQNPFGYLCFSKTHALSPRGRCRPFDASADGIVISEGVAMVVLKRLADAERDGDRIYAVIKGVGGSSDGARQGPDGAAARGPDCARCSGPTRKAGVSPATRRADRGARHRHGRRRPAEVADAQASVFGEAGAARQAAPSARSSR